MVTLPRACSRSRPSTSVAAPTSGNGAPPSARNRRGRSHDVGAIEMVFRIVWIVRDDRRVVVTRPEVVGQPHARLAAAVVSAAADLEKHPSAERRHRMVQIHLFADDAKRADGKAVLGIVDRRLQNVFERFRSEARQHFLPAPERPWNGHGQDPARRHP